MKPYLVAMIACSLKQPSLCVWGGQLVGKGESLKLLTAALEDCRQEWVLGEGRDWAAGVTYLSKHVPEHLEPSSSAPVSYLRAFPNFLLAASDPDESGDTHCLVIFPADLT